MLHESYYGHSSHTLVLKWMRAGCCSEVDSRIYLPVSGGRVYCPFVHVPYVRSHTTEAQYSIGGVIRRWL